MAAMQSAIIPTFLYGTAWKEERTAALTELALRAGFRAIDTANQRKHYFEAGVGRGLTSVYAAGVVARKDLFCRPSSPISAGRIIALPYDLTRSLATQVAQSMASSLEHLRHRLRRQLRTAWSFRYVWNDDDSEVWQAMRKERDAGRTRLLGVSNVGLEHLGQMKASWSWKLPTFVQNRCFARDGWDREVRAFCKEHKHCLSGILTAHGESRSRRAFVVC